MLRGQPPLGPSDQWDRVKKVHMQAEINERSQFLAPLNGGTLRGCPSKAVSFSMTGGGLNDQQPPRTRSGPDPNRCAEIGSANTFHTRPYSSRKRKIADADSNADKMQNFSSVLSPTGLGWSANTAKAPGFSHAIVTCAHPMMPDWNGVFLSIVSE
jgi:hypothetical protein